MSAPHKASFGWAVLYPLDKGFGCPGAPSVHTVAATRQQAMESFTASWTDRSETASATWQRAYRAGWRLARVSITPSHGYSQ